MKCLNNEHQYDLIHDSVEAVVEVCNKCKKKLVSRKDKKTERIDNKRYLKEHVVDFAQPNGRTRKIYEKHYGKYRNKNKEIKDELAFQKEEAERIYREEMQGHKRAESSNNKLYY